MHGLKLWFNKYFDRTENILLPLLIVLMGFILWNFGSVIAPFLASLLLAYFLNGITHFLVKKFRFKRSLAIIFLFSIFALLVLLIYLKLIPLISSQLKYFIQEIPNAITRLLTYLQSLPNRYPHLVSQEDVAKYSDLTNLKLAGLKQMSALITPSLNSLSSLLEWIIYLFLVPIITFLILKDKSKLTATLFKKLPVPCGIMLTISQELQTKLGRYLNGIMAEALIVAVIYIIVFFAFRLHYSLLLGILGGIAVFVPIIGTLIMTIPVLIIGFLQFGFSSVFIMLVVVYLAVHLFDAYILAPWLFGKTLNLHPLAIIFALVLFGGVLGFWGLVFAIPFITSINIILNAYLQYGQSKSMGQVSYSHC